MMDPRTSIHAKAVEVVVSAMARIEAKNPGASVSDWANRCLAATAIASDALLAAKIEHGLAVGGYRILAKALGKQCDFVFEVSADTLDEELTSFDLDRVACHTWIVLRDGTPIDASLLATVEQRLLPPFRPRSNGWRDHLFCVEHPAFSVISLEAKWISELAVTYHAKTVMAELAFALEALESVPSPTLTESCEAALDLALHRLSWIYRLAVSTAPNVAHVIEIAHPFVKGEGLT